MPEKVPCRGVWGPPPSEHLLLKFSEMGFRVTVSHFLLPLDRPKKASKDSCIRKQKN